MMLDEGIRCAEEAARELDGLARIESDCIVEWLKELRDLRKLKVGLMNMRVPCPVLDCGGQLRVVLNDQGYFLKCNHYDYCVPLFLFEAPERKKAAAEDKPINPNAHHKLKPDEDPTCPCCGAKLKVVCGRYGDFWGCSRYPNCHYSRNISSTYDAKRPAVINHKHDSDYRFPQEMERVKVSDNVDIDEDYEAYGSALPEDVYGWDPPY